MSRPARKPVVLPEATQELRAADALQVLAARGLDDDDDGEARTSGPVRTGSIVSESSIAPVGLDLRAAAAVRREEEVDATVEVRLPRRRRSLGVVLVATAVLGCTAILAAAVSRAAAHREDPPATTAQAVTPPAPPSTAAPPAPDPAPAAAPDPAPAPTAPSTGTVRLARPAAPGRVWLDGQKLTAATTSVSCGTHLVRVGLGRTHSIDVPCGGELAVTR